MSILGINTKLALPLEHLGATDAVMTDGITTISTNTLSITTLVGTSETAFLYLNTRDGSVLQDYTFDIVKSSEIPVVVTSETTSQDQDILTVTYTPTKLENEVCLINLTFPNLAYVVAHNKQVIDTSWTPPQPTVMTEVMPSPNQDDDSYSITIPFPFIFDGVDYGNDANGGMWVGTNSYVTFGQGYTLYNVNTYNYNSLPLGLNNGIAIAAGDYSAVSIKYGTVSNGSLQELHVKFELDCLRNLDGSITTTYTVIFRSDNTIIIDYGNFSVPNTYVDGVVYKQGYYANFNPCFYSAQNSKMFLNLIDATAPIVTQYYIYPPVYKTVTSYETVIPKYQVYVKFKSLLDTSLFTVTPSSFDFGDISPNPSSSTTVTVECSDPSFDANFLMIGFYATDPDDTAVLSLDFKNRVINSRNSVSYPIVFKPKLNKVYSLNVQPYCNGGLAGTAIAVTGSDSSLPATLPPTPQSTVPAPLSGSTVYHTYTNYSTQSLRITDASIINDPLGEFEIVNMDILIGLVLRPTESASIPITYTPKQQYYQLPQVSVYSVMF